MQRILLVITLMLLIGITALTVSFIQYQHTMMQQWRRSGCINLPATPDYLSTERPQDAIAAIDNAHRWERLPELRLPRNFYQLDAIQQQFTLVNLERTARGLHQLTMDANLARMAQGYSEQLRDLNFFSHTSPISGTFRARINSNPTIADHYSFAAENLAGNPVGGIGPLYEYMYDDAAEGCAHRRNILNPDLAFIGIGLVPSQLYGTISVQEFLMPAPWNPYRGSSASAVFPAVPTISISAYTDTPRTLIYFHASVQKNADVARITWFLDRVTRPMQRGASWVLDLRRLSPGQHTIFAYAVNDMQEYGVASYNLFVTSCQSTCISL